MTNEETAEFLKGQVEEITANAAAILDENKRLKAENDSLKGIATQEPAGASKEKIQKDIESWGQGKGTSKTSSTIEAWAKSRQ